MTMFCRRDRSAVWPSALSLVLAFLCVAAVFAETGIEVFFVHQDNFTLPPTFERQTVR
ncbi:hypothetical protein DPMN_022953 [Dreissena polymorpha]|uniref:Uncharacterized protein n=2 Tax=Dreissena polymorpha TaxID=45954 RepID=A0A9D4LJU2_DREPO|nr:hypothetical protein DPMN_022953 [Dreissena polymorpha]